MSTNWIDWLEDLTQEDGQSVGRKCANLGELSRAGFHVPPGFALCLAAYEEFMQVSGAGVEIHEYFATFEADPDEPKQLARFTEASAIVRDIIEAKSVPPSIAEPLVTYYDALCVRTGIPDVPVATRSAGPASHPGQYETFLNVTGSASVLENVKKVWSSTFNARSLVARARKGLPLDRDPIGVAILSMVAADAAGVMFTAEPTTADATRMIIEGSRGLGESVVGGAVIPDNWIVDATDFTIVERTAAPGPSDDALSSSTVESGPCLRDEEVIELAKVGKLIEGHFGTPQDIEWAIDRSAASDPVFILQARPETFRINFTF